MRTAHWGSSTTAGDSSDGTGDGLATWLQTHGTSPCHFEGFRTPGPDACTGFAWLNVVPPPFDTYQNAVRLGSSRELAHPRNRLPPPCAPDTLSHFHLP